MKSTRILTRCPACGNDTLTINAGHLLCTWVDCKDPTRIDLPEAPLLFVRPWKAMTDAELTAAFATWGQTDTRYRAVWEVLSRELEAELQTLARIKDEPMAVMRWAGRIEALMFVRTQLHQLRSKGGADVRDGE